MNKCECEPENTGNEVLRYIPCTKCLMLRKMEMLDDALFRNTQRFKEEIERILEVPATYQFLSYPKEKK